MENICDKLEELVKWFELENDPWFVEKRASQLRDLQSFQRDLCLCIPQYGNYKNRDTYTEREKSLLERANKISPYISAGQYIKKNQKDAVAILIPAKHVKDCVCAAPII